MVFTLEPPAAATSNAIREVIVNFGDGTVRNIGSLLARTTVAYTYTRAGVYTVTATATDVMNFTATSSIAVTINEASTVPITILGDARHRRDRQLQRQRHRQPSAAALRSGPTSGTSATAGRRDHDRAEHLASLRRRRHLRRAAAGRDHHRAAKASPSRPSGSHCSDAGGRGRRPADHQSV